MCVIVCGCRHEASYALINDGVGAAPRNHPPVQNTLCFSLVAVDGHSFERERARLFEDAYLCALVEPGRHLLKVQVAPIGSPEKVAPYETTFSVVVAAGKKYIIASKDREPTLVEEK